MNWTQVTGLSHQGSNHWATTAQPTTSLSVLPYVYCTGSTGRAAVLYLADHPIRSQLETPQGAMHSGFILVNFKDGYAWLIIDEENVTNIPGWL